MSEKKKPKEIVIKTTDRKDAVQNIIEKYKIEIIKDEPTPKVLKISSVSKYVAKNIDMLSSIGLFLSDPANSNAVGLAANQVSCNGKRIPDNFFMIKQNVAVGSGFDIIFNPEIVEKRGMITKKYEGCLTWTDKYVVVDRQPFIAVNYQDMTGTKHEGTAITGFEAEVWQHEVDHLNGVKENLIDKKDKPKDISIKTGRNDSCPCGSGEKYKKCYQPYDMNW